SKRDWSSDVCSSDLNLVLDDAVEQSFDVHGGKDRNDCTNIAGTAFVIHHNTFLQSHKPAVRMRGIPMTGAWIYKNQTRTTTKAEIGRASCRERGERW